MVGPLAARGGSGGRLLGGRPSWVGAACPRRPIGPCLAWRSARAVRPWSCGRATTRAAGPGVPQESSPQRPCLERLPGRQWVVLHDLALPGSRANVDHLVIGPTGVWVVDTKAYRARLDVRWRSVLVGSVPLSTAAVRWEAERVSRCSASKLGRSWRSMRAACPAAAGAVAACGCSRRPGSSAGSVEAGDFGLPSGPSGKGAGRPGREPVLSAGSKRLVSR